MEQYITYFVIFMSGIALNSFWNYLYASGSSIQVVKTSMTDGLIILAKNIETVYSVSQLKIMALEIAGKDEKYIQFQKSLDDSDLHSMKNTVVRNYINAIPPKYNHLVSFHNWETAMVYLNNELKKLKEQ
jgi:hypothetical protein